jgi:hypothetical protein
MAKQDINKATATPGDVELVLSSLEADQLVEAKKHHYPRRRLHGYEIAVLCSLRIYLLYMLGVVFYQAWMGAR